MEARRQYPKVMYETGKLDADIARSIRKIRDIAGLKDGWNGKSAKAFKMELIQKAFYLVGMLERQPEIFPTACGTVQMEYDGIDKSYLEIEVSESPELEVFMVDRSGKEHTERFMPDASALNELVERFYGDKEAAG